MCDFRSHTWTNNVKYVSESFQGLNNVLHSEFSLFFIKMLCDARATLETFCENTIHVFIGVYCCYSSWDFGLILIY